MDSCKAQIDPVEFGKVQADNENHKKHAETVNEKLTSLEKKVDSIKWYVLLGLVGSTTLAPEAKNVIIALVERLISVTYAAL